MRAPATHLTRNQIRSIRLSGGRCDCGVINDNDPHCLCCLGKAPPLSTSLYWILSLPSPPCPTTDWQVGRSSLSSQCTNDKHFRTKRPKSSGQTELLCTLEIVKKIAYKPKIFLLIVAHGRLLVLTQKDAKHWLHESRLLSSVSYRINKCDPFFYFSSFQFLQKIYSDLYEYL